MISPVDHIKLSIPKPCSENWDEMTPVEKGHFCQHCCKKVIDFSQLSDEEVVTIISQQKGEICGRFLENQLSRPLILPSKPSLYKNVYGKMAAAFLLFQIFVMDVRAQKKAAQTTQQISEPNTAEITIRGVLLDFETRQPISYRRVYFNNAQSEKLNADVTDDRGNFSIKILSSQLEGAFLSFDQNDLEHFIPDEKLISSTNNVIKLLLYQYPVQKMPVTTIRFVWPKQERLIILGTVIQIEPGPSNFQKLNQLQNEKH